MPEATPFGVLAGVHVLLVEDEPDSRELLKAAMEYAGALVTEASSARAAVSVLRSITPDVLVSDIVMAHEDGFWLLREVRALERGARIPAVAVTALGGAADRRRIVEAGFQAQLTKPVDPWELCAIVAGLARRAGP